MLNPTAMPSQRAVKITLLDRSLRYANYIYPHHEGETIPFWDRIINPAFPIFTPHYLHIQKFAAHFNTLLPYLEARGGFCCKWLGAENQEQIHNQLTLSLLYHVNRLLDVKGYPSCSVAISSIAQIWSVPLSLHVLASYVFQPKSVL